MNSRLLSDLTIIKGGSGFPEIYQGKSSGHYPFIKVSDMNLPSNGRYISDANNYVDADIVRSLGLNVFPKNTLVFAKVGAAVCLNKRRMLTRETVIDNNMMGIIPLDIDCEFLFQFMMSIDLAELVQPGALPSVNQEIVGKIRLHNFTKLQQKKIAKILTTIDNLIEQTQALIDKYTAIKQGMMADLFTRGIDVTGTPATNPNHGQLRPSVKDAPELYKETELGWVPKEWEVYSLLELAEYKNGNSFKSGDWKEEGLPIIRIQNLNGGSTYNYFQGAVAENWHVVSGDLLFAWSGQRGVSFGPRIWRGPEGVLNQHIFKVVETQTIITKPFLFHLLKKNIDRIEESAHGFKDSFLHVTRKDLGELIVAIPSIEEQKAIELAIKSIDGSIENQVSAIDKLNIQKKGLMQDLLTGKVPVKA